MSTYYLPVCTPVSYFSYIWFAMLFLKSSEVFILLPWIDEEQGSVKQVDMSHYDWHGLGMSNNVNVFALGGAADCFINNSTKASHFMLLSYNAANCKLTDQLRLYQMDSKKSKPSFVSFMDVSIQGGKGLRGLSKRCILHHMHLLECDPGKRNHWANRANKQQYLLIICVKNSHTGDVNSGGLLMTLYKLNKVSCWSMGNWSFPVVQRHKGALQISEIVMGARMDGNDQGWAVLDDEYDATEGESFGSCFEDFTEKYDVLKGIGKTHLPVDEGFGPFKQILAGLAVGQI